jgi:hypothetical protein
MASLCVSDMYLWGIGGMVIPAQEFVSIDCVLRGRNPRNTQSIETNPCEAPDALGSQLG